MLNVGKYCHPIRRIWVQQTSTSSTSLQAKSSWFTAWSFRLSESRLIFVIVGESSREMVWSSFATTMEVFAIIRVRQWHFLECTQTIQSLFFFIHASMSEMFFFLFDLVCFGRYLQFEQYISGIILSFLLCGCALAYVFIHIGQLLHLPFSNYYTVVKQLKADIYMYKESITWKSLRPFMLFPPTCWLQKTLSRKQLSLSRW